MGVRQLGKDDLGAIQIARRQFHEFRDAITPCRVLSAAGFRVLARRWRSNSELRIEKEQLHAAVDAIALFVFRSCVQILTAVVERKILTDAVRDDVDLAVALNRFGHAYAPFVPVSDAPSSDMYSSISAWRVSLPALPSIPSPRVRWNQAISPSPFGLASKPGMEMTIK